MPNVLFLSSNDVFKTDITDQIKHQATEFEIIDNISDADVIIVDEDSKFLDDIIKTEHKAPIIFLSKSETENSKIHHTIIKPFSLSQFIDDIKASINLFSMTRYVFFAITILTLKPF